MDKFTKEPEITKYQAEISFKQSDLEERYSELAPRKKVDLVTIGCPQASFEEIERTAYYLEEKKINDNRLWVFTSSLNFEKAQKERLEQERLA